MRTLSFSCLTHVFSLLSCFVWSSLIIISDRFIIDHLSPIIERDCLLVNITLLINQQIHGQTAVVANRYYSNL